MYIHIYMCVYVYLYYMWLPRWLNGKESTCRCKDTGHGFDPWVGKIPWRRAWQPAPVFLPGESHELRSLVGYSPEGHRVEHDWAHIHMCVCIYIYIYIYHFLCVFTFQDFKEFTVYVFTFNYQGITPSLSGHYHGDILSDYCLIRLTFLQLLYSDISHSIKGVWLSIFVQIAFLLHSFPTNLHSDIEKPYLAVVKTKGTTQGAPRSSKSPPQVTFRITSSGVNQSLLSVPM